MAGSFERLIVKRRQTLIMQDFLSINMCRDILSRYGKPIIRTLLMDKTTKRNIIWATDDYRQWGALWEADCPITIELITEGDLNIIQPRMAKAKADRTSRTKEKAEVSTPAWICNRQNNLIDEAWFGVSHVFNCPHDRLWRTTDAAVPFKGERRRRWHDYVDVKRLEIACGEAPYLTSRYDMSTGDFIQVPDRIGLLDRKLRVVSENTDTADQWMKWALRALESIYGFELQGDSLLIARMNILYSFIENMFWKFSEEPPLKSLRQAANIIAWNIWQMDGLTGAVPFGTVDRSGVFPGIQERDVQKKKMIYCKIRDWRSKETLRYDSLLH